MFEVHVQAILCLMNELHTLWMLCCFASVNKITFDMHIVISSCTYIWQLLVSSLSVMNQIHCEVFSFGVVNISDLHSSLPLLCYNIKSNVHTDALKKSTI